MVLPEGMWRTLGRGPIHVGWGPGIISPRPWLHVEVFRAKPGFASDRCFTDLVKRTSQKGEGERHDLAVHNVLENMG